MCFVAFGLLWLNSDDLRAAARRAQGAAQAPTATASAGRWRALRERWVWRGMKKAFTMNKLFLALNFGIILALGVAPLRAQDRAADVRAGRDLSLRICTACHLVSRDQSASIDG
jgi:hypothetical protein